MTGRIITAILLVMTFNITMAQDNTLRLIYPQWQGGDIAKWITEVKDPEQASRGYYLGAHLLDFLAPSTGQKTLTVPVSTEICNRVVTDGVLDRDAIAQQTRAALDILDIENPDRIVTLGGECSVSVVPFTWLASKYPDDVAVIWIDAHPDITLPGDVYPAYHAMAVTALMGDGDKKILGQLPAKIDPSRILFVGLRDWERDEIKVRQNEYGIKHLTPEETVSGSEKVIEWLRNTGGMLIAEVVRVINDVAKEKNLVGLTVAEPMPRTAIILKEMLNQLPLLK